LKIHRVNKPQQQVVYINHQHQRKLVTLVYELDLVYVEQVLAAVARLKEQFEGGKDTELDTVRLIEAYDKLQEVSLT
jgi:translation initiation factor 1 (eIF-1/SUI1)